MPLRVGMLCPYSLSVPGGVQAQALGLARELRSMGIEVRVLAPCDGPPPASFVTPLGNSLPTAANGSMAPLAPDAAAALRTIRALLDEQFDVLHVHEPFIPGPTMTALLVHTAPIVATFHAAGESAGYRLLKPLIVPAARNIAHRVVVSKDALALVGSVVSGDIEILYNGVELDVHAAATPHPTTGPTIFFCGRHEERKGLDVLLGALQLMSRPDLRVWVGGSGPDTARLRQRYADDPRIEWLGRITDADKLSRLRGAHVFCAPSLHGESFGVVLIEAMASCTPIVASSLDGYRNVATDDVDAVLVAPGDAPALAAALDRVLGDPVLARRLVEAGHRRAQDFSMAALATRYAAIYAQLVAAAPPAPQPRGSRLRARVRRMMAA